MVTRDIVGNLNVENGRLASHVTVQEKDAV